MKHSNAFTPNVGILTVSDRCAQGEKADESGPAIRRLIEAQEWHVRYTALVPDEKPQIIAELVHMADELKLDVVLTTGGTGFGPRDMTPEATLAVVNRVILGIPEMIRHQTAQANTRAWLSRAVAGLRKDTLIINLPGNPGGVKECLEVLLPLLPHALEMIQGKSHEESHIVPHHR